MADYAIGIDLGATKIAAALIDRQGHVLATVRQPTRPQEGITAVIERIVACFRELELAAPGPVAGLGLGAPASVDCGRQLVIAAVNLGWYDVRVGALLLDRLGSSWKDHFWVDKDVAAAVLGEFLYGAGQGVEQLLYIGVGTGVGAGQILDGRLYHGASGSDGNIGHLMLNPDGELCKCGKRGCLETLVSGPAIARHAVAALQEGETSLLASLDVQSISAVQVVEAAKAGDELSRRLLQEAGHYLGIALAYYVDIMSPGRILIGGGVMAAGDLLLDPARQTILERALPANVEAVQVMPAALSDGAAIGAASFIWHYHLDRQ